MTLSQEEKKFILALHRTTHERIDALCRRLDELERLK